MNQKSNQDYLTPQVHRKLPTQPPIKISTNSNPFIIHHLASPYSGLLNFNRTKLLDRKSRDRVKIEATAMKRSTLQHSEKSSWSKNRHQSILQTFRKSRSVNENKNSIEQGDRSITQEQLGRLKSILRKSNYLEPVKKLQKVQVPRWQRWVHKGWIQDRKNNRQHMFGRQFVVQKIKINKEQDYQNRLKSENCKADRQNQKKLKRTRVVMRSIDGRKRKDSFERLSLTGWLVDDIND